MEGHGLGRPTTAIRGVLTLWLVESKVRLPWYTRPLTRGLLPLLLTLTANIAFSPGYVNLSMLGANVTFTSGGMSTLIAYTSGGP